MGIPAYFSQIIRQYPEIIDSVLYDKIDNLLMDCNSIIYDCYHSLETFDNIENDIIEHTIKKIREYINIIKPTKCIYIAFVGIAPFAKIEQHRKTRQRTTFESKHPLLAKEKKHDWSTNNITAGMLFMNRLSKEINIAFKKKRR